MRQSVVCVAVLLGLFAVSEADAQTLGTFRWQLQPFCNVITVLVRQEGAIYTLDGYDDQCGAGNLASMVGTAFFNPDGSIGFGLAGASAPGAAPVVLYARISPSTINGTWSDSAGNSGTMVFNGAATGLPGRPIPPNGIRPGSITSAQIAAGAITAANIAPGTVQPPITGQCPVGQYLRGFTPTGQVICEAFFAPNVSTTADDVANFVGISTSIAVPPDGRPIVAHIDATANALRVTKCGNPACSAGNVSTTVDDPANALEIPSIAIAPDALPIIAYSDSTARTLKVVKCGNAACSTGNAITTADDPADQVGLFASIAIGSDGLPVISHLNLTANALRVTHCGNATCSSGNISTNVDDPATNVGQWTSIAIGTDGLPVISHQDATLFALRVTHCGDVACTAGNLSTTVDDQTNTVGYTTSIEIGADGLPIIAQLDLTAGDLRVTHCGNTTCSSGNVTTAADDSSNVVGVYPGIGIGTDSRPVISHWDASAGTLKVTHCGNAACTAGNVNTTVDDPVNQVGQYTSLAIGADGLPVISHFESTANALRVTKCASQGCR